MGGLYTPRHATSPTPPTPAAQTPPPLTLRTRSPPGLHCAGTGAKPVPDTHAGHDLPAPHPEERGLGAPHRSPPPHHRSRCANTRASCTRPSRTSPRPHPPTPHVLGCGTPGGVPTIRDVADTALAPRRRTALMLRDDVTNASLTLARAREPYTPLASTVQDELAPELKWWNDGATADTLRVALANADAVRTSRSLDAPERGRRSHLACLAPRHARVPRAGTCAGHVPAYPSVGLPMGGGLSKRFVARPTSLCRVLPAPSEVVDGPPPVHGIAMIRTWAWAWATSQRCGDAARECPFCGSPSQDHLPRVLLCSRLWARLAIRTSLCIPTDLWDLLGLRDSPRLDSMSAKSARRPREATMRLSLACDIYHKMASAPASTRSNRTRSDSRLEAAIRNARRRFWAA